MGKKIKKSYQKSFYVPADLLKDLESYLFEKKLFMSEFILGLVEKFFEKRQTRKK